MSEINNIDLYQQIQIDTNNIQNQQLSNEITTKKSVAQNQKAADTDFATKIEISKQALAEINNLISKEDSIITNLNKTNEIYENLSSTRALLSEIYYNLKNTDIFNDIDILKELDERTNNIIIDIEKLLKKEEKNGLIDFNYTNIFLNGLTSIRKLDISDDNYLTNLENVMSLVINKENSYKNLLNEKLKDSNQVNKEYDALITPQKVQDKTSDKLQQEIILDIHNTSNAVTKGLTPETVLRLLNL